MQLNSYLTFNGQCEAAFKFYEKVLGGKIEAMKGIMVTLGIDEPAEAERIFHALSENATVQMPIQETFWARRFGMLVDQFGTPWMVNCEKAA